MIEKEGKSNNYPFKIKNNWKWLTVDDITEEIKNGTTIKQNKDGIGPRVSRIESVQNNDIDLDRLGNIIDESKIKDKDYYIPGDIALSHINSAEHVGKTALIKDHHLPLVHGMNLLRLRFEKQVILPEYFSYYSQSIQFKDEVIQRINRAVNQVSLNQKNLKTVPVPIPPLPEQQRIVNRIESLFEKIGKAEALINEAREGFEKRKEAILAKAFRGELTGKWREENGIGIDTWKTKKIENIAILVSGQHIMNKDYNKSKKGIGYLTGPSDFGEMNPRVSKWTEKPKKIAEKHDVLITVKGSGVGKVNILDIDSVAISRQLMAIRSHSCNYKFAYYYLTTQYMSLQMKSTGSAIPGLSRNDILSIELPIPSLKEQLEIVKIITSCLSLEDDIATKTDLIFEMDLLKKSVLAKAFRGELTKGNI